MPRLLKLSAIAILGLSLSACFNGSSGGGTENQQDVRGAFSTILANAFQIDPNGEPITLNDKEIVFNDETNNQAFESLL